MDKPNSAICARRFARTSEAEWVQSKYASFFFHLPSVLAPNSMGMSLDSPIQQKTGRILVTLLPWGWGGTLWNTTGGCTEVVPVCSSWQITQYLLANILLKWFSRCMYWICFSESRVGFEAERSPFPGHQCMCQCDFQDLDMSVFWKWWLKCSVLVSWDLKGDFLSFWTHPCQSNGISRCTLVLLKVHLFLLVL